MKVCLSSRQAGSYLVHADEIKVQYRDRAVIPELAEKYPKATIILRQDIKEPIDFNECEKYKVLTRDKLMLCLNDLSVANECKKHEIPFYWGWRVQTYSQLNSLKFLGVSYVLLDAPLFFELDKVKSKGIPIRAIPNIAYSDNIPRIDGVSGTWIRPEDMEAYEEYIDVIEFEDCDELKEQALYRIYCVEKEWVTDLGGLITDLNHIGNNRFIRSEESRRRINCGQRCESNGTCHICRQMLNLANVELIKEYKKSK